MLSFLLVANITRVVGRRVKGSRGVPEGKTNRFPTDHALNIDVDTIGLGKVLNDESFFVISRPGEGDGYEPMNV